MPNEDLYTFISYGKRKGNKITYTRLKSMPVHQYYEEEDINVVCKIMKISKGKIKIGKNTFTKKDSE